MRERSIVTKIVVTVSGVVTFLFVLSGLILMKLETDMIEIFIEEHLEKITQSISDQEKEEKKILRKNIEFNSKILSLIGTVDIYNYRAENLQQTLQLYLESPEITAIRVLDEFGNPFAAAWKSPDISIGKSFPGYILPDGRLSVSFDSVLDGKKLGKFEIFYMESMLSAKIATARKNALEASETFRHASRSRLNKVRFAQLIWGGAIILIQIILLIILLRGFIIKPLSRISAIAYRLSDLDLTLSIDPERRTDEMGKFRNAVGKMVAEFKKVVIDVKSCGKQLALASGQMNNNISTISSASEEMSLNVQDVSKSAVQVSQNVNAVAGAIEQMSVSIREVGENARQGSSVAEEAVAMIREAGDTMHLLGESANEIGEVTEVIRRIAEKTTLLALNADIEAASAGEAGRGFAVVANEIKEFATQSTRAADDIAVRISGMRESTEQAVTVISKVSGIIETISTSSETTNFSLEEQMKAVNEISVNASQADVRTHKIASSVAQLAQGANEISVNVGIVAGRKDDNENDGYAGVHYMDASAVQVARLAGRLLELVDKFRI